MSLEQFRKVRSKIKTESEWRSVFAKYQNCNTSLKQFCADNGFSKATFYKNRDKYAIRTTKAKFIPVIQSGSKINDKIVDYKIRSECLKIHFPNKIMIVVPANISDLNSLLSNLYHVK